MIVEEKEIRRENFRILACLILRYKGDNLLLSFRGCNVGGRRLESNESDGLVIDSKTFC